MIGLLDSTMKVTVSLRHDTWFQGGFTDDSAGRLNYRTLPVSRGRVMEFERRRVAVVARYVRADELGAIRPKPMRIPVASLAFA